MHKTLIILQYQAIWRSRYISSPLIDVRIIMGTLVYAYVKKGYPSRRNAEGLFVWVQSKLQYIMRLFQT